MKPARRTPGPRPRAWSHAVAQSRIWDSIRARRRPWSAGQIAVACRTPINTVHQYLAALSRGGFIVQMKPPEKYQGGSTPALWIAAPNSSNLRSAPIVTWVSRTAREQGTPTP